MMLSTGLLGDEAREALGMAAIASRSGSAGTPGGASLLPAFRMSETLPWYSILALNGSGELQSSVTSLSGHVGQ